MASALAQEKGVQWTLDAIVDLWHVGRLQIEDLPEGQTYSNEETATCKHVESIFKDTRVFLRDTRFYERVCKRSSDVFTHHPVLVIGNWRQGKSTLINALTDPDGLSDQGKAKTGRRSRTTMKVALYPLETCGPFKVLLADSPGLDPDTSHDIMQMYRDTLRERGYCPDVLTDLIVLVVAGTSQGISSLESEVFANWIRDEYTKARAQSCGGCTILPVITHGDHIDQEDLEADKKVVEDRLRKITAQVASGSAAHRSAQHGAAGHGAQALRCDASAHVMEPLVVVNPDAKHQRLGRGIVMLRETIVREVKSRSQSREFKAQWSGMLTKDLREGVVDFRARHPHDETETRLFHRTVAAVLATYGKRSPNIDTALPNASWHLLDGIERKLRGEEHWRDRFLGKMVGALPVSPREVSPLFWPTVVVIGGRQLYNYRSSVAQRAIEWLKKVL